MGIVYSKLKKECFPLTTIIERKRKIKYLKFLDLFYLSSGNYLELHILMIVNLLKAVNKFELVFLQIIKHEAT